MNKSVTGLALLSLGLMMSATCASAGIAMCVKNLQTSDGNWYQERYSLINDTSIDGWEATRQAKQVLVDHYGDTSRINCEQVTPNANIQSGHYVIVTGKFKGQHVRFAAGFGRNRLEAERTARSRLLGIRDGVIEAAGTF